MQQVGVGHQPFLGRLYIELQAIAIVWIDAVVAAQIGITDAGHQQVTQARVISQAVFFALILERQHPLPATGQLAVPFRANGEQLAQGVGAGDLLVLVATGKAKFIGQRRIERNVVPQPDVLPRCRQFGFPTITVALRVDPMTRPVGLAPRTDVCRKPQAQAHGAWLASLQLDRHRNALLHRSGGRGIHAHTLEIATRLQGVIEFGNQFRVVRGVSLKWHHALQQGLIERCVAVKADLAQTVAWATLVDQFNVGHARLGVDCQALTSKTPTEETVTRSLVLNQALGIFVLAMIEYFASAQGLAVGQAKCLEFTGRAIDANGDITQVYRLARLDGENQLWLFIGFGRRFDLGVDLRLVVTQRLGCFARLLDSAAAEAQ
ncbi:hypothetical protein D3C78_760140 [compost metagenome]